MKKFLAVMALTAVSFVAFAGEDNGAFIKLEGAHYNVTNGDSKDGINLQIGKRVTENLGFDLKQEFRDTANSQSISNRFEIGSTYQLPLGPVKVGARGAIGEKFTSGDNYGYWLVEPFVAYDLTKDLTLKGSWRHRDAFDTNKNDQTNTYKVGAAYNFDKNWVIDASVGRTNGDVDYTQFQTGLTFKF